MYNPINTKEINNTIKKLKEDLKRAETFSQGVTDFLELHKMFYASSISDIGVETYEDLLWKNLDEDTLRTSLNSKGRTIIYGIWHVTRIEDLTMNMLVDEGEQIYKTENYREKINAGIDHTGNSLDTTQILKMSHQVDIHQLKEYRNAVGKQSQKLIQNLNFSDMKKRVKQKDIERILKEGGVDNVPEANWLLDFWAKKNTNGILFMPACRHQLVHLNECFRCTK